MKNRKKGLILMLSFVLVFSLFMGGCGSEQTGGEGAAEGEEKLDLRVAMVLPGATSDADYNSLGYVTLTHIEKEYGMDVAYTENAQIPDIPRILNEYINSGFNVIWSHGNQFNEATIEVAEKNPDVSFIIELDVAPAEADRLPNIFYVERNYHSGYYVQGAAAALASKTGKIGYVGGLELPYQKTMLNAIQQAIDDLGIDVKVLYSFTGDNNDALKAKQSSEAFIAQGCDVLISGVNMGTYGIFNAVTEAQSDILVGCMYSSKAGQLPDNYLSAELFDFNVVMEHVIESLKEGVTGDVILMEYGKGKARYTEFPLLNVSEEVNAKAQELADAVESGEIVVEMNMDTINVK